MSIHPTRKWFRLLRVGAHLAYGAVLVAFAYPWLDAGARARLRQHWSTALLAILKVRLRLAGDRPNPRLTNSMLVSNHISWLDVFVITSLYAPAFVCKDDVRSWPLVGWLCACNDAVFIRRGRRRDARRVSEEIARKLRAGAQVAAFPEGTTTSGEGAVLPFHAALIQAALDARCPVLPLALRYLDERDLPTAAAAYCGDTNLWESLCAIAAQPKLIVQVSTLPAIDSSARTRRGIAEEARAAIQSRLESDLRRPPRDSDAKACLEPAVIIP